MLTLKQMAKVFQAMDRQETDEIVFNQVRGLANRYLITASEKRGGRGSAGRYDHAETARARVLLELTNSGYTSAELRLIMVQVARPLVVTGNKIPPSIRLESGERVQRADGFLQSCLGAEQGEDWRLCIERWVSSDGQRTLNASIVWADDQQVPQDERVESMTGHSPRSRHEVYLKALCLDLQKYIAAVGDTKK